MNFGDPLLTETDIQKKQDEENKQDGQKKQDDQKNKEEVLKPSFQAYKDATQKLAGALAVIGKEEGADAYRLRLRIAIETLLIRHLPVEQQLEVLAEINKRVSTSRLSR